MENEVIGELIPNDYFGMAQDLKRMRKEFVNNYEGPIINRQAVKFYKRLIEFEDYCLDQEYIITGGLPID